MQSAGNARSYSAQQLALLCAQIQLLLKAGVFLADGIASISEDSKDGVLADVSKDVRDGISLAGALDRTGAFPRHMISMVEIGEKGGHLEVIMGSLSEYYEQEVFVRKQIKVAVFYPLLHACMMIAVIAVLSIVVLPIFSEVFAGLGGSASSQAAAVLQIGQIAGYISLALTVLIALTTLTLFLMMRSKRGYELLSSLLERFPPTRRLSEKIASGRFAFALSLLLSSGYDLDGALKLIPDAVGNSTVRRRIAVCRESIAKQCSLIEAIELSGLFSGVYVNLLNVGQRTGALDIVSRKIADIYAEEIDDALSGAIAVIEPVLVAVLCAVIGAILLSVMLPLMSIMTSIG